MESERSSRGNEAESPSETDREVEECYREHESEDEDMEDSETENDGSEDRVNEILLLETETEMQ